MEVALDQPEGDIDVKSRKRWGVPYSDGHPFELVRSLARQLRRCAETHGRRNRKRLKYVWACFHKTACGAAASANTPARTLGFEEWLTVIDECAALGANTFIITVEGAFPKHVNMWETCRWAQSAHDMFVCLHFPGRPLARREARNLAALDAAKTCFMIPRDLAEPMAFIKEKGFRICEVSEDHEHTATCTLPGAMTCIGADGHLYTCGVVIGEEDYCFGNFFDKSLEAFVEDQSNRRAVPEDVCRARTQCAGCPPLMAKHLSESGAD